MSIDQIYIFNPSKYTLNKAFISNPWPTTPLTFAQKLIGFVHNWLERFRGKVIEVLNGAIPPQIHCLTAHVLYSPNIVHHHFAYPLEGGLAGKLLPAGGLKKVATARMHFLNPGPVSFQGQSVKVEYLFDTLIGL